MKKELLPCLQLNKMTFLKELPRMYVRGSEKRYESERGGIT
jgi:hypothetical protein